MENRLNTICEVRFAINAQRVKQDGSVTIYLRIKVQREKPIIFPMPVSWPLASFDNKKYKIKPRYLDDEDYVTFTTILETERAKYWRVVKRYLLKEKFFSADDIKDGVKILTTGETIANYIKIISLRRERDKQIKNHTGNGHRSTAINILIFTKQVDPEINEIGKKWLDKYLTWLMKTRTYAAAWTHVKNIRTYIHDAKRADIAISETFAEHQLTKPESDPVWLDRDDQDKLLRMYNDPSTSRENTDCLRSFLFACFTGLRISDLKRFDPSWIKKGEIVFNPAKCRLTEKRPQTVRVPILPVAEQFINSLNGAKLVNRSDQKFNERLKMIAIIAEIDKKLTTHVARHTFGTMLAVNGTPLLIISALMGHKTPKSTMVYIHIAEQARQAEMLKLQSTYAKFTVHRNLDETKIGNLRDSG